ncbi:FecCD family ABC transporter permease [Undibacterium oligocarboniphilum]|uniref:Iron ABC transporter permease n=1 Tax=Undibacterium oligocarboniphilum TaxID=666702 RepID=A0A850QEU2_9BURK|nr:iron ABC transporter permease [Undibacterium oligocarboniphilum]MBC3869330.1 iron ABC transporter permease [Undibacterium oligocarboniphilum]NVO77709.1 iron ABC transporter permease [Undibacterium oligocarboniphilum]
MTPSLLPAPARSWLRPLGWTLALTAGALLVAVAGLMTGTRSLTPSALVSILLSPDDRIDSILVWTLRLPRSLAAFVGGAGLGVSGFLLQTLTRNPLAGPGLTGVSSGAVAAIVFCFVFLPRLSPACYPLIGMAGGLAAAVVTFWIAHGPSGRSRSLHLALGGISVSMLLSAVTTYIMMRSGAQVKSLLFWLSGGFQGRSWSHLAYMTPWVAAGIAGALVCRRVIGLMTLSDEAAAGMGIRLAFWKPVLLVLAVLPVAGVTPVAGPVTFVGLVSPHIARFLKPGGPGWTIGFAATIGGFTTVAADIVARTVALPRELPVSIVAALVGGPVFIYLIQSKSLAFRGEAAT